MTWTKMNRRDLGGQAALTSTATQEEASHVEHIG